MTTTDRTRAHVDALIAFLEAVDAVERAASRARAVATVREGAQVAWSFSGARFALAVPSGRGRAR